MPNYCDYRMKVIGSKASCTEFVNRLTSYKNPNHFYRIFEAEVYDEETIGDETSICIGGYCAWSLESCCRAGGYSNGVDLFEVNTKELGLKLEAYSRETGIGFEEHYVYDNGKCIFCECVDIEVYWWDRVEYPTYEDFKADCKDAPPEDEFEMDEVVVGGLGYEPDEWHI